MPLSREVDCRGKHMVLSTTQQKKNTQIKSLLIGTLRSLLYTQVSVDIGILYAKLLSSPATTSIHHGASIWWPWAQGDTVPWEVKSKDVCRCCVWRPVCVIERGKGKKGYYTLFLEIENWFWQLIEGCAYLEAALSPVFFPLHSSSAYDINSSYLSIKWSPTRDKVAVLLPSHRREKKFSRAEEVKLAFK